MFLRLTGGRTRGYNLVGVCMGAGDEVDEVARQENENRVRAGVEWAYWGVINCTVERQEA
jgi:hypothetical protein